MIPQQSCQTLKPDMAKEGARFVYVPLNDNEIRILHLLPGLPGTILRGTISHVELPEMMQSRTKYKGRDEGEDVRNKVDEDEDGIVGYRSLDTQSLINHQNQAMSGECGIPNYEALSYVWGKQDHSRALWLSGAESYPLKIGPNLYDALAEIRPAPGQVSRPLWVDQICINQADIEERSAQVVRMGDIYKAARGVFVWLGQEDEYTALGFDYARSTIEVTGGARTLSEDDARRLSARFATRIPRKYMDHHFSVYGDRMMEHGITDWCNAAVRKITDREWFTRAWTFQEVKLAQHAELICGPHNLTWNTLQGLMMTMGSGKLYEPQQEGLELTKYLRQQSPLQILASNPGALDFLSLLRARRSCKCSDPRDKVVALLGLADEAFADRGLKPATGFIRPNYLESVEELYLKTARYLLRSTSSLDFLCDVVDASPQSDLPSWVPDWRQTADVERYPTNLFHRATRSSPFPKDLLDRTSVRSKLAVRGIKQGYIGALCCYDERFVEEFFGSSQDVVIYSGTGQPIDIAVKQTMMRGMWAGTDQHARASFLGLPANIATGNPHSEVKGGESQQLKLINDRFNERDCTIQAFRSSEGHIGFGPKSMQVGDEIHLLLGLDFPAALRPTEGGYRFVGCCYVHGLMHGEGLHPDRKPSPCDYPGSSSDDEFWPLSFTEQRYREINARRSPFSHKFANKGSALRFFKLTFQKLLADGYIRDPSWRPLAVPERDETLWLFERGFDPIPIFTEDIVLV